MTIHARMLSYLALPFFAAGMFMTAAPAAHAAETIHVSKNWSGYTASGGSYSAVSATWIVPAVSENPNPLSASAAWVGIGGLSDPNLIQAGTQAVLENGQVSYQAWYETLPDSEHALPLALHPGDTVSVSIREVLAGLWQIHVTDQTTGQGTQTSLFYDSSNSSAEWIVERPLAIMDDGTGYLPLNDFGTVSFQNVSAGVNGDIVPLRAIDSQQVVMSSSGSSLLAAPSAITSDGSGFSVSYLTRKQSAQYLSSVHRVFRPTTPESSNIPASSIGEIGRGALIHIVF
ncbi:MAG: G1 family glutamic endopeptidase [Patescibacteria group bacterium]